MAVVWTALLAAVALCLLLLACTAAEDDDQHYVNEWAAEIPGGPRVAEEVALLHGYRMVREVISLPDVYILKRNDVPHRSKRHSNHHTKRLVEDDRVNFVEQQRDIIRTKRNLSDRDIARRVIMSGHSTADPDYNHQWYMNGNSANNNRRSGTRADLRVTECWKMNITGKGIVVTILDDGLEKNHTDLAANYDPEASHDLNANDPDPSPRYDITNENKHGTRCAGEVAMVANNNNCGVGIAFDCKIGGVRMLDGPITDRLEGEAVAIKRHHVDIYSASWGPNDDGKTVEGPGILGKKGLELGIKEGRDGKGVLYVWASGNGGTVGDNCNADGYTSSIYTISVSSATQFGNSPWYAEKCASTITTAYSSGSSGEGKVTSSDLHGKCTHDHTGTSAAAPLAAGVLALVLERNPDLTWRDVQHMIVHTSRVEPLALENGWYVNGVGYCVNLKFGFGLMDAKALVDMADPETWKPVGEQKKCVVEPEQSSGFPKVFKSGNYVEVHFKTDGCAGQPSEINYLEHVQVVILLDHEDRGKVYAELQSPMGTITPVFLERKMDKSKKGFNNWPLTSMHNWGENPEGTWIFRVGDRSKTGNDTGVLKNATLVLYGTTEQPAHQEYIAKCNNINKFVERLDRTKVTLAPTNLTIPDSIKNNSVDDTFAKLHKILNKPHSNKDVQQSLKDLLQNLQEEESS